MRAIWASAVAAAALALGGCERPGGEAKQDTEEAELRVGGAERKDEPGTGSIDVNSVPRTVGGDRATGGGGEAGTPAEGAGANKQHQGALETEQHTHPPR